ncbi:hypothetical protein F5Y05DRAFT_365171 [Hypoxylon sp. FL0543]|nr:hypothetical protein F5Y05DRAFT_365171 [Hypoxylon sp. FL0543]
MRQLFRRVGYWMGKWMDGFQTYSHISDQIKDFPISNCPVLTSNFGDLCYTIERMTISSPVRAEAWSSIPHFNSLCKSTGWDKFSPTRSSGSPRLMEPRYVYVVYTCMCILLCMYMSGSKLVRLNAGIREFGDLRGIQSSST